MKFESEAERYLLGTIKRFFAEELEQQIGDLKATEVLDFFVKEIGPAVYNQAIADAQTYFMDKTSDLAGVRYEPEFDFWKRHNG